MPNNPHPSGKPSAAQHIEKNEPPEPSKQRTSRRGKDFPDDLTIVRYTPLCTYVLTNDHRVQERLAKRDTAYDDLEDLLAVEVQRPNTARSIGGSSLPGSVDLEVLDDLEIDINNTTINDDIWEQTMQDRPSRPSSIGLTTPSPVKRLDLSQHQQVETASRPNSFRDLSNSNNNGSNTARSFADFVSSILEDENPHSELDGGSDSRRHRSQSYGVGQNDMLKVRGDSGSDERHITSPTSLARKRGDLRNLSVSTDTLGVSGGQNPYDEVQTPASQVSQLSEGLSATDETPLAGIFQDMLTQARHPPQAPKPVPTAPWEASLRRHSNGGSGSETMSEAQQRRALEIRELMMYARRGGDVSARSSTRSQSSHGYLPYGQRSGSVTSRRSDGNSYNSRDPINAADVQTPRASTYEEPFLYKRTYLPTLIAMVSYFGWNNTLLCFFAVLNAFHGSLVGWILAFFWMPYGLFGLWATGVSAWKVIRRKSRMLFCGILLIAYLITGFFVAFASLIPILYLLGRWWDGCLRLRDPEDFTQGRIAFYVSVFLRASQSVTVPGQCTEGANVYQALSAICVCCIILLNAALSKSVYNRLRVQRRKDSSPLEPMTSS